MNKQVYFWLNYLKQSIQAITKLRYLDHKLYRIVKYQYTMVLSYFNTLHMCFVTEVLYTNFHWLYLYYCRCFYTPRSRRSAKALNFITLTIMRLRANIQHCYLFTSSIQNIVHSQKDYRKTHQHVFVCVCWTVGAWQDALRT